MKIISLCNTLALFSILFFLTSCVNTQDTQISQSQTVEQNEQVPAVKKLDKKYTILFITPFTITPELRKNYPEAAKNLQQSMLDGLKREKIFTKVEMIHTKKQIQGKALVIKANISKIEIINTSARFLLGALAGSSGVEFDLQLVDGKTGKVVRTEHMSSWNNSLAASWNFGASDRSLLDDMGKITAKYITQAMPIK